MEIWIKHSANTVNQVPFACEKISRGSHFFSLREPAIKCLWKTIVQIIYIFIAKVSPLEQIHLDKSRNENWLTVMHTFIAAKNLNASVVKGT